MQAKEVTEARFEFESHELGILYRIEDARLALPSGGDSCRGGERRDTRAA